MTRRSPAARANSEIATNGNHLGPSDVGIWYCTYYGDDWKVKYAIAAGSHKDVYGDSLIGLCMEKEAQDVYETFFQNKCCRMEFHSVG